ncbi:MAG: YcaO-like family protein [Bradyrhizobium sp.]
MKQSQDWLPSFAKLMETAAAAIPETGEAIRRLMARRNDFGITRLGSVTGLDRVGIPVAQVVRPGARSNAVAQGKGATVAQAAISALMEALETWAAERIAPERTWLAPPSNDQDANVWAELWQRMPVNELHRPLMWIEGWDVMSGRTCSVPLALVDTVYTLPSPHAAWLPRNTTGLAAGTDVHQAVRHACLEILERDARYWALRKPHFFDRYQVATASVVSGRAGAIVARLRHSGLQTGIWSIPAAHGLPIYWCQVMEGDGQMELAPLPAEGFGCDTSHDAALSAALLEACQARMTAIAGAREDVTADFYRGRIDRGRLAAWRMQLGAGGVPLPTDTAEIGVRTKLDALVEALRLAGAGAAIVVPLFVDLTIPLVVVRVVAPPLRTNPEESGHGS